MEATATPTTPAGVAGAGERGAGRAGRGLWAARTPEESWRRWPSARRCAPTWPRSRPPRWPRSRTGDRQAQLAWASTGDWFTHAAGTHRRTGSARSATPSSWSANGHCTRDALRDGLGLARAGRGHLRRHRGAPLEPSDRELAEKTLLDEAARLHATDLAKAASTWSTSSTPRKPTARPRKTWPRQDRAAHLGRYLAIADDGAGGVRLRGRGTVEDAARSRPRCSRSPSRTPADRTRTAGSQEAARPRRPPVGRPRRGLRARPDHRPAARTRTAPDPGSRSPPASRRCRSGSTGPPTTDDGGELSPAAVRRLACDADIIPVVLGTRGEVLDVGRARRLVTPAIWRALVCRDQHCAFPGCTRPPVMGHAHHIVHWADDGPPAWTTWSCSAATTTGSSTTPPGRSGSTQTTADPSSSHPRNPDHHPPPRGSDNDHDASSPGSRRAPSTVAWCWPQRGAAVLRSERVRRGGPVLPDPGTEAHSVSR